MISKQIEFDPKSENKTEIYLYMFCSNFRNDYNRLH